MADATLNKKSTKKLIMQLVCGAALGFVVSYLSFNLFDLDLLAPDALALAAVGMVYVLCGLIVAIGLLAPSKIGEKMLNVEDAGELNEQRRVLTGSSISMFTIGAGFIVLVMAGPNGTLPPVAGFAAMIIGLLVTGIVAVRDWKYYDELLRQVSVEASYVTFCGLCVLAWFWCAAAWVGWTSSPTPLGILAAISGTHLVGTFYVAGKRGMMTPR